jgi:hypothetical protein
VTLIYFALGVEDAETGDVEDHAAQLLGILELVENGEVYSGGCVLL